MLIADPIYTVELPTHDFSVPPGSSFLYSHQANEDRAVPSPNWFRSIDTGDIVTRTLSVDDADDLIVASPADGSTFSLSLFDVDEVALFLESLPQPVYLDITGLPHRLWAPLVRGARGSVAELRVVYLEPVEYRRHSFSETQRIFDLSDKFDGLRPLPGFVALNNEDDTDSVFVPMVGFEGSRLEFVLTKSEADLSKTFPIIGVPGYQPDYAFYALQANRTSLEREYLHTRIQYAKANCPFEAFYLLEEIQSWSIGSTMRIAPIGTKPHALGAILFALANPSNVEIVYDNPVRARDRSHGQARVLVYAVSAFLASPRFHV